MQVWVGPTAGLDSVKKKKKCLFLLEIELKFLGHTPCSLVTVMTGNCIPEIKTDKLTSQAEMKTGNALIK